MEKSKFNLLYEEIIKNHTVNEVKQYREFDYGDKPLTVANIWKQKLYNIFNNKMKNLNIQLTFKDYRNIKDQYKINKWLCYTLKFDISPNIIGVIYISISPAQRDHINNKIEQLNNKEVRIEFYKIIKSEDDNYAKQTDVEKRTLELTKPRNYMTPSEFPTPEIISEIQNIYKKMYEEYFLTYLGDE